MNRASATTKAIISPPIDAICGGGLSLVIAGTVILYGLLFDREASKVPIAVGTYLFTDLLINGPHFMASYRLLYSRRKNFRIHPLVTIGIPIIALGFLGYVYYQCAYHTAATAENQLWIISILNFVAPIFLGWHYMGQSWGMTACFAYLGGLRMTATERRLIRCGFHALFVYHVSWAYTSMGIVQTLLPDQEAGVYLMRAVMSVARVAMFVGFFLGLWGFRRLSQREGKRIPTQMWLPWLATFSWYIMADVYPDESTVMLLQAFHALQYLSFPVRVELNNYTNPLHKWRHLMVYYVVLVFFGLLAFNWADLLQAPKPWTQFAFAIVIVLNLHHYFTDAVIWKIRNPEVRQSLFGHLETSTS